MKSRDGNAKTNDATVQGMKYIHFTASNFYNQTTRHQIRININKIKFLTICFE